MTHRVMVIDTRAEFGKMVGEHIDRAFLRQLSNCQTSNSSEPQTLTIEKMEEAMRIMRGQSVHRQWARNLPYGCFLRPDVGVVNYSVIA